MIAGRGDFVNFGDLLIAHLTCLSRNKYTTTLNKWRNTGFATKYQRNFAIKTL